MAATAFVRARMDETIKNEAADVLAEMGLTISDVMRMTLTRIARDGALPFELKAPNAETRAAMAEGRAVLKAKGARFADAEALIDGLDHKDRCQQARVASAHIGLHQDIQEGLGAPEPFGSLRHGTPERGDDDPRRQ